MKVIFVCTGNTCRSPMAEGYLKAAMIPNLTVESRGIFADGSAVSENSVSVMKEIGIDISKHVSTQFTINDLDADLIICLSVSHRDFLISFGADADKTIVLNGGISDPFGASKDIYRHCRDEIIKSIDEMIFGGMFTPFSLKPTDKSVAKKIANIERECFSEPWSENAILESINSGTVFFTVCHQTDLLGYVGISVILDEGYIANIAVTKKARNQGVAGMLMNRLDVLARDKKLSFISLEVRASNISAQSLYKKFGYQNEGIRKNFYKNPSEDAVIMTKRYEFNENFEH